MRKLLKKQNGETLIEVIFAFLLFFSVIVSLISADLYFSRAQVSETGRLVAGQLAREGVEGIRNLRDSNWLAGLDWDNGLFAAAGQIEIKGIIEWNPADSSLIFNSDFSEPQPLYSHGSYWNGATVGGTPLGFSRLITLERVCDGANLPPVDPCAGGDSVGVKVISEVQWEERGAVKSYQLVDYLYNWR